MPGELAPQRATRLEVQRAVDRLVRDLHLVIVGVLESQPARDLLRGVILPQPLDDNLTQLATQLELRRSWASRPTPCGPLCRVGAIAPTTAATVDLAGDRGVRPAEGTTDSTVRFAPSYPARDLLTLGNAQPTLRPTTRPRPDPSLPLQVLTHRPLRQPEPPADLRLAHPLRSQRPDRVLHNVGQIMTPRHLRTSLVGQRIADSPGWCGGSLKPPAKASLASARGRGPPIRHEQDAPLPSIRRGASALARCASSWR